MKKWLCLLLASVLLLSLVACRTKEEVETPLSSFKYAVSEEKNMAGINGFIGDEKNIVIPKQIDGYDVKIISFNVFAGTDIESVIIPSTVEEIWDGAFANCKNLHTVTMRSTALTIGHDAFRNCTSLKDLHLPTGLTFFGFRVFSGCTSLEKVTIPNTVTQWGMEVFLNCPIKELTFEDGIKSIGQYANFWGATVEEITIPAGVEKIGEYAFRDNLKKVVFLGDAPKDVGKQPFGTDAVIYYPEDSLGWDTTPLKDEYVMIAQGQNSDSNTTDSSNTTPSISKKQYMTHDESQVYEWKCDIDPTKIKDYSGSPLEGFFITTDDELYEYNSEVTFPETEKNYRKIDTELKIIYIYYRFQLDRLSVLTDDFKTYTYNKEEKTFTNVDNDFGSVVKEFSERGRILLWGNGDRNSTVIWFMDKDCKVYNIKQTQGTEYTQTLMCTVPTNEKIVSSAAAIIKTENKYYYFDSEKSSFKLGEEPTAAYDNIAYLNDFIVMYKDDPTHIYDHNLIYSVKFSYD